MPSLILASENGPTMPCRLVIEPVFSLIVQGAKRVEAGNQIFDYRQGQFLVVSVDLPASAYVVEATPAHTPARTPDAGLSRSATHAAFLSRFGPIRQHFILARHRMNAACHRAQLEARLHAWDDWAGVQLFKVN